MNLRSHSSYFDVKQLHVINLKNKQVNKNSTVHIIFTLNMDFSLSRSVLIIFDVSCLSLLNLIISRNERNCVVYRNADMKRQYTDVRE